MAKVKLFAAIPRKRDVTRQEFHDHWRHPHGTLARHISTIRKYVQSHQIQCALLDDRQTRYEGIAEVWMDSVADATALAEEPTYVRDLVPDEPAFIELADLRFLIAEEDVLVSGPDHRAGPSKEDACWYDDDRAVNIKLIQLMDAGACGDWRSEREIELGRAIGVFRHVCCSPASAAYSAAAAPFGGVRELWWPTLSAFQRGCAKAPDAFTRLIGQPNAISVLVHSERFK
jgi:uncharacterized protein (TIGR02118 family)